MNWNQPPVNRYAVYAAGAAALGGSIYGLANNYGSFIEPYIPRIPFLHNPNNEGIRITPPNSPGPNPLINPLVGRKENGSFSAVDSSPYTPKYTDILPTFLLTNVESEVRPSLLPFSYLDYVTPTPPDRLINIMSGQKV
jgi:hypothetical protein